MESKTFSSNSREPQQSEDLSSRRVRYFGAFTLLIGMFLFPKLAPSYMDTAEKSTDRIRSVDSTKTFLGDDGFVNTTVPLVTTRTTTTTRNGSVLSSTCKVPDLTAGSNQLWPLSACGKDMGKRLGRDRKKLAEGLPLNPRAHLFHFPTKVYNHQGQRPILCVPQKNGNKQFGGLVSMHAAWNNKKPPVSGEQVDGDMSRFERHGHVLQKQTGNHHQEHVYFVARNPYTRILSL